MPNLFIFLRRGCLLLGACLAMTTPWNALRAQTSPANIEALRSAKNAAAATFLDRKRPDAERLQAANSFGYPDAKMLDALVALGIDPTQSEAIRWEALRRVHYGEKYLDAVLKILGNPEDGSEELQAHLIQDLSQKTAFSITARDQERIQAVERKLLGDKRDKVRLYAYRALVANHDVVAINQLVDSLRKQQDVPIPLPDAIDLLDEDGSASYIGVLRPYLSHNDPRVQARAARALALDPESRPKIVELAVNAKIPSEIRINALRGLAREDKEFAGYAIRIVENSEENPDIRSAAMHHLAGRLNYHEVAAADQIRFADAVAKLAAEPALLRSEQGAKLTEAARQLHLYLKQTFPEIKKHYEKP